MENTQKPSLFLVGRHQDLETTGIPFMEEMVTWPLLSFRNYPETCKDIERGTIVRNALVALSKLVPFHVKISVAADIENKQLCYQHRTWGKIFLEEENVLTFSHHSEKDNFPFYELVEWVELPVVQEHSKMTEVLITWSVEQWVKFFKERIIARAIQLKTKANKKKEDACELEKSADTFLIAIATTSLNSFKSL